MTKSAHDIGCGARKRHPEKCDCKRGLDRKIKQKAKKVFDRQRKTIAEKTGLPYEETVQEVKHGHEEDP